MAFAPATDILIAVPAVFAPRRFFSDVLTPSFFLVLLLSASKNLNFKQWPTTSEEDFGETRRNNDDSCYYGGPMGLFEVLSFLVHLLGIVVGIVELWRRRPTCPVPPLTVLVLALPRRAQIYFLANLFQPWQLGTHCR